MKIINIKNLYMDKKGKDSSIKEPKNYSYKYHYLDKDLIDAMKALFDIIDTQKI